MEHKEIQYTFLSPKLGSQDTSDQMVIFINLEIKDLKSKHNFFETSVKLCFIKKKEGTYFILSNMCC